MKEVTAVMNNTIPISLFNRGIAGKIFRDVKSTGTKVVMKNNIPECVLMSPDEYVQLMEELHDARLRLLAQERMSNYDPHALVSEEEMEKMFGITPEDVNALPEVLFE